MRMSSSSEGIGSKLETWMVNKYTPLREAGGSETDPSALTTRVIPLYTANEDPRFLRIPHRKMVL